MPRMERISPADTTWLRMDRPSNPMVINGVLVLEGPLDLDALERTLITRFAAIPRFRERVELRLGEYWWCEDPGFESKRHVRRVRLPGKGGRSELQDYVSELASDPLDRSRPLWQIRIVEQYEGGAAVVIRVHHAIADGIALVGVLLLITDQGAQLRPRRSGTNYNYPGWRPRMAIPGLGTITKGLKLSAELLKEVQTLAANPAKTAKLSAGITGELAYLLLMPQDTPTRFKGTPKGEKRVAWTDPIALPEVKAVSQVLGCSINDMLLASVTGALGAYLKEKGDHIDGVEIRALVPINMRTPAEMGELGNRFGIIAVELPVGIENPLARLQEVRRRMDLLKQSLEPPVTLGLIIALGYAPKIVQDRLFNLLLSRATAVMTNVPGPQHALYMAGALIKQVMFWVPQSADIGMGISVLSFNNMVQFGLMTDAALVPDPEAIIAQFKPKFEQLLYFILMEPWHDGETAGRDTEGLPAAARRGKTAKVKRPGQFTAALAAGQSQSKRRSSRPRQ